MESSARARMRTQRWRAGKPSLRFHDGGSQRGNAVDRALDNVARFQKQFRGVRLADGDIVEGVRLPDAERALADDENQLWLIVQTRNARRARDARVMAHEAGIQLDESCGLLRRLGEELVGAELGEVAAVVLAYAQEL